jgi:NADH:ubiquinone oxidoreductase subunit K
MVIGNFGIFFSIILFILGILAFIFNGGRNLIMIIISLELILLSIGLFLIHFSFHFDDLVGANLTLYLLP